MSELEHDRDFLAALDECCRRLRRGERIDQCLADYGAAYRSELARLAPVALLGWPVENPTPEFREQLERRLLAALDAEYRTKRRTTRWLWGAALPSLARVAAIALIALLVMASGAGIIQASDDSLPDSPLYQVKAAREWAELKLARSGEDEVDVQAQQIDRRGRELASAVQSKKQRVMLVALALRLAATTERAVNRAVELRARGNPRPATRALAVIRVMQQRLDRLAATASTEQQVPLRRLRAFLEQQEQRLAADQARAL